MFYVAYIVHVRKMGQQSFSVLHLTELSILSTYILQISVKLANDVFFVPILTTCGGFMTNFFFSPVTISGFLARIMSNTLVNNCADKNKVQQNNFVISVALFS